MATKQLVPPRPSQNYLMETIKTEKYVVMQVTLKEKLIGTGSKNLTELEEIINTQVKYGYRLHTMSTSSADSTGFLGGDRIQATLVFERIDFYQQINGIQPTK